MGIKTSQGVHIKSGEVDSLGIDKPQSLGLPTPPLPAVSDINPEDTPQEKNGPNDEPNNDEPNNDEPNNDDKENKAANYISNVSDK